MTILQIPIGYSLHRAATEYLKKIRSNRNDLRSWFGSIATRYEEELDDLIHLWEHTMSQPATGPRFDLLVEIGDELARLERISSVFLFGNVDEAYARAAADWRNERSSK